jgi:hypothetical protein
VDPVVAHVVSIVRMPAEFGLVSDPASGVKDATKRAADDDTCGSSRATRAGAAG